MPLPSDEWVDADFLAPSATPFGTVGQLESAIRARLSRGESDGGVIENLRLLILTRLLQGRTQSEVEDEIAGWGLAMEYAIELVSSTRTAGRSGGAEAQIELTVNGVPTGAWRSATEGARRQLTARADRRDREARRLAGFEPAGADGTGVDLGFTPQGLPSDPTPGSRRKGQLVGRSKWNRT